MAVSGGSEGQQAIGGRLTGRVGGRPSQYCERMRLDEEKIEALRRWGQGLREASSEESAAAGRAILLLIGEIERLRLELLRAREQLSHLTRVSRAEAAEGVREPVASTLHGRVQRVRRRDSDSSLEPRPTVEEGEARTEIEHPHPASAQSWIETLRRQK
jgi:hypothetical protein